MYTIKIIVLRIMCTELTEFKQLPDELKDTNSLK